MTDLQQIGVWVALIVAIVASATSVLVFNTTTHRPVGDLIMYSGTGKIIMAYESVNPKDIEQHGDTIKFTTPDGRIVWWKGNAILELEEFPVDPELIK